MANTSKKMLKKRHHADFGNRRIQNDGLGGLIETRPAFIKYFEPYEDEIIGTEVSPLVEINENGRVVRYLIGLKAQNFEGQGNLQSGDKVRQMKHFFFATLPAVPQLEIEQLFMAVPDARSEQHQTILNGIIGTHEFLRNGNLQSVTVKSVKLVDETKAAYLYALNNNLLALPTHLNAVWSIGGGDFSGSLIRDKGEVLKKYNVVLKRGTVALATEIAAAKKSESDVSINLDQIMDAIEDGTLITYGGVDFSDIFENCTRKWLNSSIDEVKSFWKEQAQNIRQTLIFGGSAELAKSYRKNLPIEMQHRIIIAPRFADAVLIGLQYA
jgi:hypothetical protein